MIFRLVPKSVTLNDIERRNVIFRYFTEFGSFRAHWFKIYVNILRQKCSPKHLVFSDISLTMI